MILKGNVFKYGDHVDTDVIIPAQYLTTADPKELAKNCMADIDLNFAKEVKPGDIIVAGINFGCGSSREHAPLAIKGSEVSCIIAKKLRKNILPQCYQHWFTNLECPEAVDEINKGDELAVDTDKVLSRI